MAYVCNGRPKGRPQQFYKYELPTGVVKIVRAQCADYERKTIAMRSGTLQPEVLHAYEDINTAINDAFQDIEEGCRKDFLIDIAENRGYDKSNINWMFSKTAYYHRKIKTIYEIARRLYLI